MRIYAVTDAQRRDGALLPHLIQRHERLHLDKKRPLPRRRANRRRRLPEALRLHQRVPILVWFRLASRFRSGPLGIAMKLMLLCKQRKLGIVIPAGTAIGPGFYIRHFGNIVLTIAPAAAPRAPLTILFPPDAAPSLSSAGLNVSSSASSK